jgi:hypothetical protein
MPESPEQLPSGYMPLEDAARWAGRSVRTVQRWIEEGRVETIPHPLDRRRRLVSKAGIERVRLHPFEGPHDLTEERERRTTVEREAIMNTAKGVNRYVTIASAALGHPRHTLTAEELSRSPFVQDLQVLFNAVNGDADVPPEDLSWALDRVLTTLHTDLPRDRIDVPDEFWKNSLVGRHLARARLLLLRARTLVSLNEIVEHVGLPRNRVENILRALRATRIYDPDDERWLYEDSTILAVRHWNRSYPDEPIAQPDTPKATLEAQLGQDIGATGLSPVENRIRLKAVRHKYHWEHFRDTRHSFTPGNGEA